MKKILATLGSLFLIGFVTVTAYASIPAPDGTITGCYKPSDGKLFVIDSTASCPSGTNTLTWNQTGPQGPVGATGATGPQGVTGPQGPAGTVNSLESLNGISCVRNGVGGTVSETLTSQAYAQIRCIIPTTFVVNAIENCVAGCQSVSVSVGGFSGTTPIHFSYTDPGTGAMTLSSSVTTDTTGSGTGSLTLETDTCSVFGVPTGQQRAIHIKADDLTGLPTVISPVTIQC